MNIKRLVKMAAPMIGVRMSDRLSDLLPPEAIDEVFRRAVLATEPNAEAHELYCVALQYLPDANGKTCLCLVTYALNAEGLPGEMVQVSQVAALIGQKTVGDLTDTLQQQTTK